MGDLKLTPSERSLQGLRLGVTVALAMLFAMVLLCGMLSVSPSDADPGLLYVDGATGQDSETCGDNIAPCKTISYTLNSRASGGDSIRVAQGVYTENLTVDMQLTLQGGYESAGWTRDIAAYETIIDGSNSRTVWGDWDGSSVHMSTVISDSGAYKMWYCGWGLADWAFGLATSSDGVDWTKHSGNPVFTATVSWEEGDVGQPHVIKDGTLYKMWYGPNDEKIGYAWSSDGIDWTKYDNNPVLEGTPGAWDENGVGAPFVIKVGSDDYRLWYQDRGSSGIGYATSTNGVEWTKHGSPVLSPGPSGTWDDQRVADPNVLFDGLTYHMWYAGFDGDAFRIGYAWSDDGINWNKSASNPVLSHGAPHEWDELGVSEPNVLLDGVLYRMWFSGVGDNWQTWQRGYATSPDPINWSKSVSNPVLSPGTPGQWGQPVLQFLEGSDGSLLDGFTVQNGEAENGGGIYVDGIQVTVQDCQVVSNTAYYAGGGIAIRDGASVVIHSSSVLSNLSQETGGAGLLVDGGTATVGGNLFAYNVSQAWWGGDTIGLWDADAVTVTNNIVVSNTAKGIGMGINVTAVNNTIAYNSQDGLFVWEVTAPRAVNNIVVNNGIAYAWACDINADGGGQILVADYNNAGTYCNDAVPGAHDIAGDPLFADAANGDYHLQVGSPCIDAGTPGGAPGTDFEGTPRDAAPDIGAYEWTGFRTYVPLTLKNFGP